MFKVEYYEKIDKTKPIEEFLMSLNDKLKVKTLRDLKLLQEFGNELREPQSKKYQKMGYMSLEVSKVLIS